MNELVNRIAALHSGIFTFNAKGEAVLNNRAKHIIAHYEREIAKGRMTLNTAADRVAADYSGSNNGIIRR